MNYTPLNTQDLEDILSGAALLGAGGGGPLLIGRQIIDRLEKTGKTPLLADPATHIGDDAYAAVSAFAGSPDSASHGEFDWSPATIAFKELDAMESAAGRALSFVLPAEVGAGNSFISIAVATDVDKPVVDASGARRAIPALAEVSYASNEIPISPIVIANSERKMTMSIDDPIAAGNILHGIISEQGFGNEAGLGLWTMSGASIKKAGVLKTMSYARELGKTIREAASKGIPPWKAACSFIEGWVLFHGEIESVDEHTTGGFDLGIITIRDASGVSMRIYNQNENLIAWRSDSDRPVAMAPDLISYITPEGQTFSNADPQATSGTEVYVLGSRCTEALRAGYIVEQFTQTLQQLGYGGPYVPIETLQGASGC